jgi:hypothetical protein
VTGDLGRFCTIMWTATTTTKNVFQIKKKISSEDIFVQILNDRHGEVTLAIITCIISLNENFKYLQKRNIYNVKIWTLVYELLHFSVTRL